MSKIKNPCLLILTMIVLVIYSGKYSQTVLYKVNKMSSTETQTGFSTANLLKSKVENIVQADAPQEKTERPRVRLTPNDNGGFNYPQIVYITKPVVIHKPSAIDKAVKGAVNAVVVPVSFVGHLAIFCTTLLYSGLKLWARTYGFVGSLFTRALLNIMYVAGAFAMLALPGLIAYFGSQYIRPMYDAYHSQAWVLLGAYSLGILFGLSLVIGLVIGLFRKIFGGKRTVARSGNIDMASLKERIGKTTA